MFSKEQMDLQSYYSVSKCQECSEKYEIQREPHSTEQGMK